MKGLGDYCLEKLVELGYQMRQAQKQKDKSARELEIEFDKAITTLKRQLLEKRLGK